MFLVCGVGEIAFVQKWNGESILSQNYDWVDVLRNDESVLNHLLLR